MKKTIDERIERILKDKDFKKHCENLRKMPNFDKTLELAEKIAQIDTSKIKVDETKIRRVNLFDKQEIMADTIEFYKMLDDLAPDGVNLVDRVKENSKYLTTKVDGRKDTRSGCVAKNIQTGGNLKKFL